MKLIVLEGLSDAGKTATINVAYQLILQAGYDQVPNCFEDLKHNDFLDVLTNGAQKVGIVSQGDYARRINSVKNHLAKLQSFGCDKAICAVTSGPKKQEIQTAIKAYPLLKEKVKKEREKNVFLHRIKDNEAANKLVSALTE